MHTPRLQRCAHARPASPLPPTPPLQALRHALLQLWELWGTTSLYNMQCVKLLQHGSLRSAAPYLQQLVYDLATIAGAEELQLQAVRRLAGAWVVWGWALAAGAACVLGLASCAQVFLSTKYRPAPETGVLW